MLNFEPNKAFTVAAGARAALASFDEALGSAADLTKSFLEAAKNSNLPARDSQKLLQTLHESAGGVVAGRAEMVCAITLLNSMKRKSDQAETNFGCPGDESWATSGELKPLRVVA